MVPASRYLIAANRLERATSFPPDGQPVKHDTCDPTSKTPAVALASVMSAGMPDNP
jgi:hypothetical protein